MLFAESDYQGLALVITAIGSLITVIVSSIGAVYAIMAKVRSDTTDARVGRVETNVQKIEVATNSMKDALVLASGKAGELKGRTDQRSDDAGTASQAALDRETAARRHVEITKTQEVELESIKQTRHAVRNVDQSVVLHNQVVNQALGIKAQQKIDEDRRIAEAAEVAAKTEAAVGASKPILEAVKETGEDTNERVKALEEKIDKEEAKINADPDFVTVKRDPKTGDYKSPEKKP